MFGYGYYFLFFILLIIIPTKQMAYIAASHEGSELKTSKLTKEEHHDIEVFHPHKSSVNVLDKVCMFDFPLF